MTATRALRHAIRITTIVAKTSFWAICYHYFGSEALLYVAAGWMFILGAKDLTLARVRLSSLKNPATRGRAYAESVAAELVLIGIRLAVIWAISVLILPFNQHVAAIVAAFSVCAGLWARETFITAGTVAGSGSLRLYVSLVAALSSIGSILYFAENNLDPIRSAIWALLIREGVTFFGFAAVALLGLFGLRLEGKGDDDDDEDGADVEPILTPDGREVRAAWKILIADNVVYSKWRMMQFATRFVAHGVLGPFGGLATRIAFSYKKPRPYSHHNKRISIGRMVAMVLGTTITISAIVYFAERAGLLHAVGIVITGFLFRLAALSLNLLMWRQLSPLVATNKKIRLPGRRRDR